MIVTFKARGISRGVRKLARTPALIIIKKYCVWEFIKNFMRKMGKLHFTFYFKINHQSTMLLNFI